MKQRPSLREVGHKVATLWEQVLAGSARGALAPAGSSDVLVVKLLMEGFAAVLVDGLALWALHRLLLPRDEPLDQTPPAQGPPENHPPWPPEPPEEKTTFSPAPAS